MENIEALLSEFLSIASLVENDLSNMLQLVSEGKVPSKEQIATFEVTIDGLRDKYDYIKEIAESFVVEEERPVEFCSVQQYADMIENSKAQQLRKRLEQIELLFKKFVSVRSFVTAYEDALRPFQEQASEMLKQLNDSVHEISDEMIAASQAHQLFLSTLETDDLDSPEGLALLEMLESSIYPTKVQIGLASKKYYLSDESVADEKKDLIVDKRDALPDPKVPEDKAESMTSDTNDVSVDETEVVVEDDAPVIIHPIIRIKETTPSASAFKKEIVRLPRDVCWILPLLTNLGVLDSDQIYAFGVCLNCINANKEKKESIEKTLEVLAAKNVLAGYHLGTTEQLTAYCLTSYAMACLNKSSIRVDMSKFWDLSFGKRKFCGKNDMEENEILVGLHHNAALLLYLINMREKCESDKFCEIEESITWGDEYYDVLVHWNDESCVCAVVGCSTENIDIPTDRNILFVCFDDQTVSAKLDREGVYFMLSNSTIYKWEDQWVQQVDLTETENISAKANDCGSDDTSDLSEKSIDEEQLANDGVTDQMISLGDEMDEAVSEDTENMPRSTSSSDELSQHYSDGPVPMNTDVISDEATEIELCDDMDAVSMAKQLLDAGVAPDRYDMYQKLVEQLIREGTCSDRKYDVAQAVVLSKAISFCGDLNNADYQRLLMAVDSPLQGHQYTGERISALFEEAAIDNPHVAILELMSILRAMFAPDTAYDYTLNAYAQSRFDRFDEVFSQYSALKQLYNLFLKINKLSADGFSVQVLRNFIDQKAEQDLLSQIKDKSSQLISEPTIKSGLKSMGPMVSICFGKGSDFRGCMEIIAADKRAEREFVEVVYEDFCEAGTKILSEAKIVDFFENNWKRAADIVHGPRELVLSQRNKVIANIEARLALMKQWLDISQTGISDERTNAQLFVLRKEILTEANAIINNADTLFDPYDCSIITVALQRIVDKLNGQFVPSTEVFKSFLNSGVISLDGDGIPIVDEVFTSVKYYEPWRNVLKHIVQPKRSVDEIKESIFENQTKDSETTVFDNLRQLEMLGRYWGDGSDEYIVTKEQIKDAIVSADADTERFMDGLELAYTYNRIGEDEKESVIAVVNGYKDLFYERLDFGCWRQFIFALNRQISELADVRKNEFRQDVKRCREALAEGETSSLLNQAEHLLEIEENFAVAEEYLNRFRNGERELSEEMSLVLHDPDSFTEFLSNEVFDPLYTECSLKAGSQMLSRFGYEYVKTRFPSNWTSRHKDDSKKLLSQWPGRRGMTTELQMKTLFTCLGFNVNRVTKLEGKKQERYQVYFEKAARNVSDYRHPIAAFGTQMKAPVDVVVLYGSNTAQQLVDTITSMNLGGISIVLIDYPLDRSVRRQIAEIFHTKTSGQNPFLLIDQVLALHLSLHQDTERLPILLKCTLPYTHYQPFVREGGSTADEMFCGRTEELATILDLNGTCVVYGGRQLGKTALLERAEGLFYNPTKKAYAVYTSIYRLNTEESVVKAVVGDINRKVDLNIPECKTLGELCSHIDTLFRNGTVSSMLLLIDEVDSFLEAIRANGYSELDALEVCRRNTKNQFKFVLAGLHNVCRANKATENNGVFGRVGSPLCIKPLSPTDALKLISRPLQYLGFQVERYPHLETILTNTNYYPGILQFFGYTLVSTLANQYGKYYRAVDGNPPFTLREDQLGAIMNSADLNNSIKEKFRLSLELDPRYFMLARCIALLYHENQGSPESSQGGFSVENIKKTALAYDINCLKQETDQGYSMLLDEMVDMGILSCPHQDKKMYRLRRHSFINIIGANVDTLLDDIIKDN